MKTKSLELNKYIKGLQAKMGRSHAFINYLKDVVKEDVFQLAYVKEIKEDSIIVSNLIRKGQNVKLIRERKIDFEGNLIFDRKRFIRFKEDEII